MALLGLMESSIIQENTDTVSDELQNSPIVGEIEDSGCPYLNHRQFLVKDVCLMPGYQPGDVPDSNIVTIVYIEFESASILEIDETKNSIGLKIYQAIQWYEPRMRAKFSDEDSGKIIKEEIKIPHKQFQSIWHPDYEVYTVNSQGSKSLYHPRLYEDVYALNTFDTYRCQNTPQHQEHGKGVVLQAWKSWKVIVDCNFDFTAYPLDVQHCDFLQYGEAYIRLKLCNDMEHNISKKQKSDVYRVAITPMQTVKRLDHGKEVEGNGTVYVGLTISLRRILSPYLFQYYFPCIAIVVISEISFIIPLSAIPGRVALVVTQFLTLINIFIHQMVN